MTVQTNARPALFDLAGRPLHVGSELGSGGEGAVYELGDRSDVVIKLYHHRPLDPDKSAKITAMAKLRNERLLQLSAWPIEPIRAVSESGPVVGFIMPKIAGHRQAFSLYSPKLRLREFPIAGWQFLIRSAANAARAFTVIHESGHVIGDVNHGNLFIGGKATVRLIDCDSYQITLNGRRWYCEVGVPTHQPPELQNLRTYKGVVRTPNHDNFGLAVIIFQMLFMARHPFSGRFLGAGEMPMERAISEYRFAYGSNAAAMQMQPPPASLGLNGVTRDMALLFERAFSKQGSQPDGRPRADEWVRGLQDLEQHLKKCAVNPAHQFANTLSVCPWCEIEAATGVPLFQVALVGSAQTGFTIAAFWARVNAVPDPGPPPALPPADGLTVTLSPAATKLQRATFAAKLVAGFFGVIGVTSRIHSLRKEIEARAVDSRSRWQNLRDNWDNRTSSKDFQDLLSYLQSLRTQYDGLPQKRLQELQKLEADRYRLQLHAHLDQCRISHARITGVGDAKKATLQSYGIETAADIADHRVLAVPGFGPVLLGNLKRWREQQEKRFKFDPNKGVDQAAKNTVERQILTEKIDLERTLNEGLSKLSVSSQHISTQRHTLLAQAKQAAQDLAQAEADLHASAISPVIRGKGPIIALGMISIGALIITSHRGIEPSAVAPQQVQPAAGTTGAISPARSLRPTLPPHVDKDASGQPRPEDGYDWSDGNHVSVRWVPGIPSNRYPNVVAAAVEGQWRPADGYAWLLNPPRLGDMRVKPLPRPEDQLRIPAPEDPLQRGLADRTDWEQWIAPLGGDFRQGAEWWASHRSLPNPGSCTRLDGTSQDFVLGCEAAKARLTPTDIKRKSDPDYRRGWNSFTGLIKPPSTPEVSGGAQMDKSPTDTAPLNSEAAAASRLNAQELRRLRGQ